MVTAIQKSAKAKRSAADRARAFRERRRADGVPLPRDVDAAISEAVCYLIYRYVTAPIDVRQLHGVAKLVLQRMGFSKDAAARAVADRMKPWAEHKDPDHVPSICPSGRPRPPKDRSGKAEYLEWTIPVARILEITGHGLPSPGP